jgi:hypothetical protein
VPARGGHVVDLALLFAELLSAPGVTQADLGRRYRKSPGYVSVVCRLGRALRELPPDARDALRVPHFTLKAAQDLVSRHRDPAALRAAAARLAALPPVVPRGAPARTRARHGTAGQWDRAPDGLDAIDPLPEPRDAVTRRTAFSYTWDAEAARRDPRAVLADFEAFVRETTDEVVRRLRHAAGDLGRVPLGGAPSGLLPRRSLRASPHDPGGRGRGPAGMPSGAPEPSAADASPSGESTAGERERIFANGFDDMALRKLNARVAETLRAHRARMDAFLAERERGRTRVAGGPTATGRGGSFSALPVDPADLDADLAES